MTDRFEQIDQKLDVLIAGQARTETRLDELQAGQVRTETRLDRLEIGQEEMADKIQQIAEGHAATQAAIERAAATVCAYIDKRITPLEDAFREHIR